MTTKITWEVLMCWMDMWQTKTMYWGKEMVLDANDELLSPNANCGVQDIYYCSESWS